MELQQLSATSIHLMKLAAEMGVLLHMEQTLQSVTRQNDLALWAERVQDCRSSGLSVKAWCAENGIVPNMYFRWQKKVFNAVCPEQSQFYEVPMKMMNSYFWFISDEIFMRMRHRYAFAIILQLRIVEKQLLRSLHTRLVNVQGDLVISTVKRF